MHLDPTDTLLPYPSLPADVALPFGELPSAADFALRVVASYQRHMVKPSWRDIASYHIVCAAGAPFANGPNTPLAITPAQLESIIVNLVTMSYINTQWGADCRDAALKLTRKLGIIWQ